MTTTYTNITLLDVETDEAATWLAENGYTAAVSPEVDGLTVIYENTLAEHADDDEPLDALFALASEISYELGCAAWLVLVDADTALLYTLYMDGEPADSYGVREGEAAEGGDAEALVDLYDAPKKQVKVVRRILNRPLETATETASMRLRKLLNALELPVLTVGYDYDRVTAGETPPDFSADDLVLVGAEDDTEDDA